jgi:hypothetical protein
MLESKIRLLKDTFFLSNFIVQTYRSLKKPIYKEKCLLGGEGAGKVRKAPKKCKVLLEWPLMRSSISNNLF